MTSATECASCQERIKMGDRYVMLWVSWADFPDYLCDSCWLVMSGAALTYLRELSVGVPVPEST